MAAAAMRGGHTTPSGEEMAGLRPATEAEKCSAAPRCIETLLLVGALVRLLLVFILALVSGLALARGLMLPESGPIFTAHSASSRTPWEVTASGSRAVDSLDVATMMADKWRARADAAAAHIQRHARGWAAREFFCGRLLARELMEAASMTLQHAWRAFAERAAAAAAEARMLEELWARPLPLPAQVLRDRWGGLLGANVAKRFARLAAIADENTHVSWARLIDGHAAVLQRAWRASAAAATWRAACHAAMRIQRAWRTARGLGPEKPRRHKPQSAKHARAQKARAGAPRGGRA